MLCDVEGTKKHFEAGLRQKTLLFAAAPLYAILYETLVLSPIRCRRPPDDSSRTCINSMFRVTAPCQRQVAKYGLVNPYANNKATYKPGHR